MEGGQVRPPSTFSPPHLPNGCQYPGRPWKPHAEADRASGQPGSIRGCVEQSTAYLTIWTLPKQERNSLCVKPLKPRGLSVTKASITLTNHLDETRGTFLKLSFLLAFDILLNMTEPCCILLLGKRNS